MLINGKDLKIAPQADLRNADLSKANLLYANLSKADLRCVDLRNANLSNADLRYADLYDADLRYADLSNADLSNADLRNADLSNADLSGVKNFDSLIAAELNICPEGAIIGYKKLHRWQICKLLIPENAKRSNATGRKCRAEYAIVLEGEGVSTYDSKFIYEVGKTVKPTEPFCEDRWQECASGIHFFLTREEANAYS